MPDLKNNAKPYDGVSWEKRYSITTGVDDLKSVFVLEQDGSDVIHAVYNGSSGITLSNYNGFPIGTVIVDVQAFKIHMKTGASTWKSSVAMT